MARTVITATVTVPASGGLPARTLLKGQVVELSASEQTAVTGAGGALRTTTAATMHDQLGMSFGVANGD